MYNLIGNSSFFPQTYTVLKTKSFLVRSTSGPFHNPPEVRDSLFSHTSVLAIPGQFVPPKVLLNEEMTVLPTQKLMDSNQKLENQNCFSNLSPTS